MSTPAAPPVFDYYSDVTSYAFLTFLVVHVRPHIDTGSLQKTGRNWPGLAAGSEREVEITAILVKKPVSRTLRSCWLQEGLKQLEQAYYASTLRGWKGIHRSHCIWFVILYLSPPLSVPCSLAAPDLEMLVKKNKVFWKVTVPRTLTFCFITRTYLHADWEQSGPVQLCMSSCFFVYLSAFICFHVYWTQNLCVCVKMKTWSVWCVMPACDALSLPRWMWQGV